jgi:hypothetical protein
MAKQTILVGTTPNDGTGDLLRNAMIKCNSNFTELYDTVDEIDRLVTSKSEMVTVEYGSVDNVTAQNGSVFEYQGSPLAVNIQVSPPAGINDIPDNKAVRIRVAAPVIQSTTAEGPVLLQRVSLTESQDPVVDNIFGFMVSPGTDRIFFTFDDEHNLEEGVNIQYRLYNATGSGISGGDVTFETSLGFQFSAEEI